MFGDKAPPELTQLVTPLQNIAIALGLLQQTLANGLPPALTSSKIYDPPSVANGAQTSTTVTVAGAALGQSAQAAFSLDLHGLVLSASVTAANTVTVTLLNLTGAAVDLASGILSVWARST